MSIWKKAFALALLTALPIAGYSNCPGNETWTGATNTDWDNAANWSPNTCVPGSVNTNTDTAIFPTTVAGAVTVTLVTPPISPGLGTLTLNSSTTSYTILGLNSTDFLQFNGTSQLQVLAGNHTITGRTTNFSGPLTISLSDPAGSLTLTNGINEVNNSNIVINGPGELIFQWDGTPGFTVFQANNYTFNSGTLLSNNNVPVVSSDGTEILATNFSILGGTVTVQNTASVTTGIGSQMALSGQLTISAGTLNVTNTGSIATGISKGSYVMTDALFMTGGSLLINNTGTVAGTGIGSLLQVTGPTAQINGGLLVNNDHVQAAVLNVGAGGSVGGNGIFQDATGGMTTQINNSGTVVVGGPSAGSAPGTMTIQGSYTQTASGDLVVNIAGPTSFSQLNITGTANLAGNLSVALSPGAVGESFKILTAGGGVSGHFANVTSNLVLIPMVQYFPNYVLLSFLSPGTGDFYPNYAESLFSSINHINQRLDRQMAQLRGRFSHTRVTFESVASLDETEELLVDNSTTIAAKPQTREKQEQLKERIYECEDRPWNVYMGPTGDVGRVLSEKRATGFHYDSVGALAGIDYAFSDLGVGFLFDYDHTHGRGANDWGKFNIDQAHGSFYATYIRHPEPQLSFNLILGGGYEWLNIRRNVTTGVARGTPQGAEFDALAGMEYTFEKREFQSMPEHLQVVPLVNLQYIYLHVNHYKERGGGMFDMQYRSQNVRSLRSMLGTRINYSWHRTNVVFTPEINLSWQWEFFDKDRHVGLAGTGFSTNLLMGQPGRNIAHAGIDFLVTLFNKYGVEASYDFEWNKLYLDHSFYVGCNFKF